VRSWWLLPLRQAAAVVGMQLREHVFSKTCLKRKYLTRCIYIYLLSDEPAHTRLLSVETPPGALSSVKASDRL